MQIKNPEERTVKSKKRAIEVKGSERSKKRRRISLLQSRNATISNDLRSISGNIDAQLSDTAITVATSATPAVGMRNALRRPISLPLRSRRRTNLLSRFK
jgi:hypothetical protein